ncbi:MAG: helix-turn-helix domain-containing protein [Victivallales bacterium]|nr:helix-turn-helix domain-containing protein [Victivallales bacterium]
MTTDVQIVRSAGVPVAAVLPWSEYTRLVALDKPSKEITAGIPHKVVEMVVSGDSPIKAWRRHLGLTQVQAAEKIGVTQGAYAQMEKTRKSQDATLRKVAAAFGIDFDQLDMID